METKIYLDDGSFGLELDTEISDSKLNGIIPLIGEIVLDFNFLENGLDDALLEVLNHSKDISYAIIAKMSFSQKIGLFKDIYLPACKHLGQPEKSKVINNLVTRLKEASENRNRVIHARWIDANKDFFVRTKVGIDKNGVYGVFFKLNKRVLNKYIRDIRKLQDSLDELYEKFISDC